jgi:hypothetical protein
VNTVTRLTINSTLLALGLALSGAQALASDVAVPTTAIETETKAGTPDQQSLDHTKAATEVAVNDAIMAAIEATRLDLDIRLIGRTSIIVAAGK